MLQNARIFTRLAALAGVLLAFLAGLTYVSLSGMNDMRGKIETIYSDQTVPLGQLAEILDQFGDIRTFVGDLTAGANDTALAEKDAAIRGAQAKIKTLWQSYLQTNLTPEEKVLAETSNLGMKKFEESVAKELSLVRAKNFAAAMAYDNNQVEADFAALMDSMDRLKQLQIDIAKAEFEDSERMYGRDRTLAIGALVAALLIGGLLAYLIARSVTAPLAQLISVMEDLSQGRLNVAVPGTERSDELGQVARAVAVFKDGLAETEKLRASQAQIAVKAEEDRRRAMVKLADDFESAVGEIVRTVASAATELQASAESMSSTAQQSSAQSTAVANTSQAVSSNVQTVAAAAEQLTASVNEISAQLSNTRKITADAVAEAERTNTEISELSRAARKIGEIVTLINDISEQTNLLALNATIEAARAGDAGKGFAVVASEVKNLANQTAKATGEIETQIRAMQTRTESSVHAIGKIAKVIESLDSVSTTIASAVEEQSASTVEIARSVSHAADGSSKVAGALTDLTHASEVTGETATGVLGAAKDLARQADTLSGAMARFLDTVRRGANRQAA